MEESTALSVSILLCPVMHKERFAEWCGVSLGVVDGWSDRGYVPTTKIGKHTLINVALLTQECLQALPR